MKFKILSITDKEKLLSEYITALGNYFTVEGVWEKEDSWDIYLPAKVDTKDINAILSFLNKFIDTKLDAEISDYDDENTDWNAEWKKGFKPVKITENIYVYPAWIKTLEEMNEKIIVRIDPQMGFGTGTHETTQLMMELIEKYLNEQKNILDAGTGSGILAILTEKLKPSNKIVAFDVDEDAIANAGINRELNNCSNIEWRVGDIGIVDENNFDFIMANINLIILMELIPELVKKLTSGGLLVLSGILNEEIDLIKGKCSELGLTEIETRRKNEWTAGVWKRTNDEIWSKSTVSI